MHGYSSGWSHCQRRCWTPDHRCGSHHATALFFSGRHTAVEHKLRAAEAALRGTEQDDASRDLVGPIASIRATLAIMQQDADVIVAQSRRALEYLHPDNLPIRTAATYTLGYAHQIKGERADASRAYTEVISISGSSGDSIYTTAAMLGLGQVQESDNQLPLAAHTYRRVLQLVGHPLQGLAPQAHLGLARISFEWNDREAAQRHAQQAIQRSRQMDSVETVASCLVFLTRLRLAQDDVASAVAALDEAEAFVRQHNFLFRLPDVAAARMLTLLRQGHVAEAGLVAGTYDLPISRARVHLAEGETSAALALLEPWRAHVEAKGWADERLKVMIVQAVALQAHGDRDQAVPVLDDALALAQPGAFVRSFVDEGTPMADLLAVAAAQARIPDYAAKLLAAFEVDKPKSHNESAQRLTEPLTHRELEVLRLITQGLSNHEIGERLFLALDTVKGHNRKMFGKLQVQRRTEAVARARELGLA